MNIHRYLALAERIAEEHLLRMFRRAIYARRDHPGLVRVAELFEIEVGRYGKENNE